MSGGHALRSVEEVAAGDSPLHRLDARTKIVGLIGLVLVVVSTPEGAWSAFAAYALLLLGLVTVARLRPGYVLRRMVIELPFLVAAGVLVLVRGPVAGGTLAARVTLSVLAVVLLSSTTPFPALLRGFQRLRAPALIVTIVGMMWRSLHLVGEEARQMRIARESRGYRARTVWQARGAVGGTIAALFVRSLERGERIHLAMTSRGYAGGAVGMPVGAEAAGLRTADLAFAAALATALAAARLALA